MGNNSTVSNHKILPKKESPLFVTIEYGFLFLSVPVFIKYFGVAGSLFTLEMFGSFELGKKCVLKTKQQKVMMYANLFAWILPIVGFATYPLKVANLVYQCEGLSSPKKRIYIALNVLGILVTVGSALYGVTYFAQ